MTNGTCSACGVHPVANRRGVRCNRCLTGVSHCECGRKLGAYDRKVCRACRDLAAGTPAVCPQCEKNFVAPKRRGKWADVVRLCGDDCKREYARSKIRPLYGPPRPRRSRRGPARRCGWCERETAQGKKWCSDEHMRAGNGYRLVVDISFSQCAQCDKWMTSLAGRVKSTCSPRCRRRLEKGRAKGRKKDEANVVAWRKSLRKGPVPAGRLRRLAERDRWCCHLCGKKVPDRAYGARWDDATEDHLIPRSQGGSNGMSNLALAHNRCNYRRREQGIVQLRLIA